MTEHIPIRTRFLNRIWYVTPIVPLVVALPRDRVTEQLQLAAQPSQKRLHLRDLFTRGRRYQLDLRAGGFRMHTTSTDYWRYTEGMFRLRRRTRASCTLDGNTQPLSDTMTALHMRAHIRLSYLLDVLWIPSFITSILVFMPWSVALIVVLMLVLFGLSFVYHYYHALYQANEMLFFVEKSLDEFIVTELPTLQDSSADVVSLEQAFRDEWERFYRSHRPHDNDDTA